MKILDELDRLAYGATPGPWRLTKGSKEESYGGMAVRSGWENLPPYNNTKDLGKLICYWTTEPKDDIDRQFIAAANPETIKALVAVARATIIERQKMIDIWPEPLDADDTESLSQALKALESLDVE